MTKIVGLLPASGSASRLSGIPKFCLPINEDMTLLQWHIEKLSDICDEIHVSTRKMWVPLIENMNFSQKIEIHILEPSTMSDAIVKMTTELNNRYIVAMPDTFIQGYQNNYYLNLGVSKSDISVAAFNCHRNLQGKVGQLQISGDAVLQVRDKDPECKWEWMWGAFAFQYLSLNKAHSSPSQQIADWIQEGRHVEACLNPGKYIDLGTVAALKNFYAYELELDNVAPKGHEG